MKGGRSRKSVEEKPLLVEVAPMKNFSDRHIGPDQQQVDAMLKTLGCASLPELMKSAVPENIRSRSALDLPAPISEHDVLKTARAMASKNKVFRSFLGMGY